MTPDEEQLVPRFEGPQRFERRFRVEWPGVTNDQGGAAGAGWRARLIDRGRDVRRAGPHEHSGGGQSERQRLATADESFAHSCHFIWRRTP